MMCLDYTYICVDTWCFLHRYPASGTRSYRLKLYHHRSGFFFFFHRRHVCWLDGLTSLQLQRPKEMADEHFTFRSGSTLEFLSNDV